MMTKMEFWTIFGCKGYFISTLVKHMTKKSSEPITKHRKTLLRTTKNGCQHKLKEA